MALRVGWSILVSVLFLVLSVWLQITSKNSPIFLWLMYSSLVFLGLATLLLISSDVEHSAKNLRRLFYIVVTVALIATILIAFSIATFPPGGTRHYYSITPEDAQINLTYGGTSSGRPGYSGYSEQTILDVDYPIGGVYVIYDLPGLRVFTDKSIVANLTVWFALDFWPNRNGPPNRAIELSEKPTTFHNGTESSVSFRDHPLLIFWGSANPSSPEWRIRLDRGYRLTLYLGIELEGPDYGGLKTTVPLYPAVYFDDVQVSSQLQDGIAILISGILAGALISIPAGQMKPKITRLFSPVLSRINRFLTTEVEGTPSSFLKKCVQCNREIPIASEECPYCRAKQKS